MRHSLLVTLAVVLLSTTLTAQIPAPRKMGTIPQFVLTDQDDIPFPSYYLHGKVWIVTFIFTRCRSTCPAQSAELAKLQESLSQHAQWDDIGLLSITVDPENDTPAVLAAYAKQYEADPAHWQFLTGERAAIWDLCKKGFKLPVFDAKDNPEMIISHSQNFVLIDRNMEIRGYYDGLKERGIKKLLRDIKPVLSEPRPATRRLHPTDKFVGQGQTIYVPPEIQKTTWLDQRARLQRETRGDFKVYNDFTFTDRLKESGITFRNQAVEDGTIAYKAVHYDHGTGTTVADVDGDGNLDIYFVTQKGENQLWRNVGGGAFENITTPAIALGDRTSVTASFADIDNDGDPDLFVSTVRCGNAMFENTGDGKFTDISAASGLDYNGHSSGAVFFDYDRDGLLDLFVCNVGIYTTDEIAPDGNYMGFEISFFNHLEEKYDERSLLYRNLGGNRFEEVAEKVGLIDKSWSGDASPIDFNRDGWPDLYVLSMQGHDQYYENVEGKKFVRKSREHFPATSWGAMGVKVFDYNNDGRLDVYVTDMHTDMVDVVTHQARHWYAEKEKMAQNYPGRLLASDGNHVLGNAFFRNDGNGKFTEVSEANGSETYWPWGLSTGDLNADGWEDIFVINSMNFPFRYTPNSVLLNDHGTFRDSEFIVGAEPRQGELTRWWFEVDCDTQAEYSTMAKNVCAGRTGKVQVYSSLGSRSSVIFDVDSDGDLDIVTNDFNTEPMVMISDLTDKKTVKYLQVQLVGSKSNRDGLGARVVVKAAGKSYTKANDGVSGYMSHSTYPLYFGLDAADAVDSIAVTWPSGTEQIVAGPIKANQTLTITEE
jgi:cytochrome oxidase Cu insertion factor (SCO1/SenC/PrrC family)